MEKKITLYGFNNLTKTLSFNIYDICFAKSQRERSDYIEYIDEQYNSMRLTNILRDVIDMIGAKILNISKQDYEPQGASVSILIAEEKLSSCSIDDSCNMGKFFVETNDYEVNKEQTKEKFQDKHLNQNTGAASSVNFHLDKSHVTVHTFPEYHPENSISTFRVDINVSTCGKISPLKALDYLIGSFDSDIITIDYNVRGFTREVDGKKCYIDHSITSIQDYVSKETLAKYDAIDVNVYQSNIFHTKMLIKEVDLQDYLFNKDVYELDPKKRLDITDRLRKEMIEIFSGMNIY